MALANLPRIGRGPATVAAALLAAACSDARTGPLPTGVRDSLEFSVARVDSGPNVFGPLPATARGAAGRIEIGGFVTARCDTWAIRAGLTRDSDGYRLRIFYRILSDFCEIPVRHRYNAVIVGVEPGEHHVRVRQPVWDFALGTFVVETVLEERVTVGPAGTP